MADKPLATGKLPMELLQQLLACCTTTDPRVLVGARVGEDAAVIDMGDRLLVAKSDPITFASDRIGWYAAHVNANDIATRGAAPRWMLATLLMPEGTATFAMAQEVMAQMAAACRGLGVSLVGGHTEVTYGLARPLLVGHMLGEVARERLVTTGGAQVGDAVLLAGGVAAEGAAILARELGDAARARGVSEATLAEARGYLDDPGISVVRPALLAAATVRVHAMHDPTEGGLATGLHELAWASGTGLRVDGDAIPVLPACARLCAAFGLEPLGLIASGALVAAVAPQDVAAVGAAWSREGIAWARIAEVRPAAEGVCLLRQGRVEPLPRYDRDEIARAFS
ncbi:MAG TPA: AIR synthase family protein [Anaerolineae bacterium]|nr:AIR synthase family protein [Anaerolineae bacterium]